MKPVCIVRREGLRGPGVAAVTALDGTQIVTAYQAEQLQQVVIAYYPLLSEAERNALEDQLAGGGVVEVGGLQCVPAEKSAQRFEPIFGDYPAAAPSHLRLWRATLKYYVVEG